MSMVQGMTAISNKPCAFCTLPSARVIDENATTIAVRDGYPVSPGHTLLMPKRHTGSFFDLSEQQRGELLVLLDRAKLVLDEKFQP